jgi:hypothetical protein
VFFTPRGKALFGAPPVIAKADARPAAGKPNESRPGPLAGAPRWKRDRDIPWEVEARAWEALDSG